MTRSALLLLALATTSCTHVVHSRRNAPGHVDLRATPPPGGAVEAPTDPGERWLVLSTGLFAGLGARGGGIEGSGTRLAGSIGIETTLIYGQDSDSHLADDFSLLSRPRRGPGITLGWSLLESDKARGHFEIGPVFLEAQYHVLSRAGIVGLAGGYAVDFGERRHGPQATLFWNMVYARVQHLFDRGTEIQFGVLLKWRVAWVRSR